MTESASVTRKRNNLLGAHPAQVCGYAKDASRFVAVGFSRWRTEHPHNHPPSFRRCIHPMSSTQATSTSSATETLKAPSVPTPGPATADDVPPAPATIADATAAAENDADLELVMAQCGVPMETACELLNQANGDIVEAIAYHLNPALAASEAHKEAQEWALVDVDECADKGADNADECEAREVQTKLAELRDILTAKNAVLDAQMRTPTIAEPKEGC